MNKSALFLAVFLSVASPAEAGHLGNAASLGRVDLVRRLLDEGGNPNEKDERSQTPLTVATGHLEVMKLLIDRGADVNLGERDGTTPLMYAAMNKRLDAARLLVEHGADLDAKTTIGWTALTYASNHGAPELLKFLIEQGADINSAATSEADKGATPLCLAAGKGNLEIVRILLDKGAAVNGTGEYGRVPLISASGGGHLQVVKALLEAGAQVDQRNVGGVTPLMAAGNPVIIRLLLEHGADINAVDKKGRNALWSAAKTGDIPAAKLLLENGAGTDARGPAGWNVYEDQEASLYDGRSGRWTGLMHAAKEGRADMVKLLLEHEADPTAVNDEGLTALRIAHTKGRDEVVSILKDWKGKPQVAARAAKADAPLTKEDLRKLLKEAASEQSESPQVRKSDVDAPDYKNPEDPSKFALVVGIEKYANLPEARFAERDAAAVKRHFLALGVPERNLVSLTGAGASRAGLAKIVEAWLGRNVKADSTLFFYYSGHGAPDPRTGLAYLVPADGDAQFLEETAYPVKRLYQKLGGLKAKSVVVVLDACFSGAGGRSVLAAGTRPLVMRVDAGLADLGKVAVLAAASAEEVTGVEEAQGHGLFTYNLLKGLNAGGGPVTLQSLFDDILPKVQDGARRQNRDQTPVLQGSAEARSLQLR